MEAIVDILLDFFSEDTFDRVTLIIDEVLGVSKEGFKTVKTIDSVYYHKVFNLLVVVYGTFKILYMRFYRQEIQYTVNINLNLKLFFVVLSLIFAIYGIYREYQRPEHVCGCCQLSTKRSISTI